MRIYRESGLLSFGQASDVWHDTNTCNTNNTWLLFTLKCIAKSTMLMDKIIHKHDKQRQTDHQTVQHHFQQLGRDCL